MQKFVTTGRAQSKDSLLCIDEMSDRGMIFLIWFVSMGVIEIGGGRFSGWNFLTIIQSILC